jgi:murein DD-endopeptidase MepM/ murein hydrolase activator NlpD
MLEQWNDNKAVVLLGAGAVVATLAARPRRSHATSDGGAWLWPVPSLNGRPPVISSGWGSPRKDGKGGHRPHRGVDIMYRRKSRSELVDRFPPGTPNGSPLHFMPDFIPVFAARDGEVWSAKLTSRGYAIVLDHGKPWATYYQHLEHMFVMPTEKRKGRAPERVRAGEVLGYIGASPRDSEGLKHLHFEVWKGGGPEAAIDPEAMMLRDWLVMPWTDASLPKEAAHGKAA